MAIQIRTSLAEPETGPSFVPHRPERPDKVEGGKAFKLVSEYEPSGDQPGAIKELTEAALAGERDQVLLIVRCVSRRGGFGGGRCRSELGRCGIGWSASCRLACGYGQRVQLQDRPSQPDS